MNPLAVTWWIIFDACLVALIFWAYLKVPRRPLRASFLFAMAATGLYFNALFAKWHSPLGEQHALLLTRIIFVSGILIHIGFGFFVAAFSDQRALLRNLLFKISQVLLIGAAGAAAATDLVIADVAVLTEYPRFQATRGILYMPLLIGLAAFGIAMLFIFYQQWRMTANALQKFQIGATLVSSGIVFVGMTFTNGIVPALTGQSHLSIWGGIFPMVFFLSVIYLIAHGEAISLKREFSRLLAGGLALHEDNQVALREVIQGLRSLLHKGAEQISRRIDFRIKADKVVPVVLEHSTARALTSGEIDVATKSLPNSLRFLYAENQRMLFSLIRAETLLQEKWLTNEVQQGMSSPARLKEIPGIGEAELDANLAEFRSFWGRDIVCASPESFALLQSLDKRKTLTHPLIITGEPATGKALLCRALHHVRGGKTLAEFSARLDKPADIFAAIAVLVKNPASRGTGILVRHADALGHEGLKTLWAFIDQYAESVFFYLTASENFIAQVGDQSLLSRLTTLALESVPLRNRPEDIELLSLYFARRLCQKTGHPVPRFSTEAMQKLKRHSWPGNVAELRETVENCVAAPRLCKSGISPCPPCSWHPMRFCRRLKPASAPSSRNISRRINLIKTAPASSWALPSIP